MYMYIYNTIQVCIYMYIHVLYIKLLLQNLFNTYIVHVQANAQFHSSKLLMVSHISWGILFRVVHCIYHEREGGGFSVFLHLLFPLLQY